MDPKTNLANLVTRVERLEVTLRELIEAERKDHTFFRGMLDTLGRRMADSSGDMNLLSDQELQAWLWEQHGQDLSDNRDGYTQNEYVFPLPSPTLPQDAPAHIGSMIYALDFAVPRGTPVRAALGGKILEVEDDSNVGGPTPDMVDKGNFITIAHPRDEFSIYAHIEYQSAKVKMGDTVIVGREIARSGSTGFSTYPHLHFGVYREVGEKVQYLQVIFQQRYRKMLRKLKEKLAGY